ncbi:MAG: TetR/AcrR family transcriptional regulator [Acidobacteriota bacterium]
MAPREAILRAALREFAGRGFEGARVERVARAARVNKALLYYYYGSKAGLYEAVLLRNFEKVHGALAGALALPLPAEGRLRALVEALLRVLEEMPEHPLLLLREVAAGGSHLPPAVLRRMGEAFLKVRALLEDGRRRGEFREVSPLLVHLQLLGATAFLRASGPLRRRIAESLGGAGLAEPLGEDFARQVGDLLLRGIGSPPKAGVARRRP